MSLDGTELGILEDSTTANEGEEAMIMTSVDETEETNVYGTISGVDQVEGTVTLTEATSTTVLGIETIKLLEIESGTRLSETITSDG